MYGFYMDQYLMCWFSINISVSKESEEVWLLFNVWVRVHKPQTSSEESNFKLFLF